MGDFFVNWLAGLPDATIPYALAALGLIISERAGVLSLGAEGLLLVGALAGIGAHLSFGGYPLAALLVSMLTAALVSALFAALVVLLRVNQVIAGLVLVFFCQGLTGLVGSVMNWTNHAVPGLSRWPLWPLSELPIVGRILFDHDAVVYATPVIFWLATRMINRTNLGLRLRAVGENPEAADGAGVDVAMTRVAAILAGSALVGLAGGYISVVSAKLWIAGMSGGRGWIAIALVIFARWSPWRALAGALLFGSLEALVPRIAAAGIAVPQYFMLMTPYLATIGVMIWTGIGRRGGADGPGALGEPFVREERR